MSTESTGGGGQDADGAGGPGGSAGQDPFVRLAKVLGRTPEEIRREAVQSVVARKIQALDEQILGIIARYKVGTPEQLERQIREGLIEVHPAWEVLSMWEGLEATMTQLLEIAAGLEEDEDD